MKSLLLKSLFKAEASIAYSILSKYEGYTELTLEEVFMKLVDGTADMTQIENISKSTDAAEDKKSDNTTALKAVDEIMGKAIEQFDHPDEIKTEKEDK